MLLKQYRTCIQATVLSLVQSVSINIAIALIQTKVQHDIVSSLTITLTVDIKKNNTRVVIIR